MSSDSLLDSSAASPETVSIWLTYVLAGVHRNSLNVGLILLLVTILITTSLSFVCACLLRFKSGHKHMYRKDLKGIIN